MPRKEISCNKCLLIEILAQLEKTSLRLLDLQNVPAYFPEKNNYRWPMLEENQVLPDKAKKSLLDQAVNTSKVKMNQLISQKRKKLY